MGIYLGYVSAGEHALVDFRLYLPREWTNSRKRLNKARVPRGVRLGTRHDLALELLSERGGLLPHAWVSGDDEMGRCSWFRQELRVRGERYLLAVPSNTLVRDLAAADPPHSGKGRRPLVPFRRVDNWAKALPESAWETIEVRDGEKGPIVVQAVWRLVQAKTEGKPSDMAETLVVFRERQGDGTWKHDYLLSNAVLENSLAEFARVIKAQPGWHHHQTLALLTTWFLTQEARRGKNTDTSVDGATSERDDRRAAKPTVEGEPADKNHPYRESAAEALRGSPALSLATTQTLVSSTL